MKKALIVLVTVLMTVSLFISCGNDPFFHYVEFDSNGGSSVERQIVRNGEKATEPKDPTKDGTEFVDWYDGENVFDFDTAITKDYKLTAVWADGSGSSSTSHTVTFVLNGGTGTGCEEQTVAVGGKAVKPSTDPKLRNAVFKFWSADGTNEFSFDTVITADTTLTAIWKTTFEVGETGPSGGTIFYVNPDYEEGSSDTAKNWKYLEAAPVNLGKMKWGSDGDAYNTDEGMGKGQSNTTKLVDALATNTSLSFPAAKACADYSCGLYDDWFLPSIEELKKINAIRDKLEGIDLTKDCCWSSTAISGLAKIWAFYYNGGDWTTMGRNTDYYVWPVRSFAEVTASSSSSSSGSSLSATFTVSFDVNGGSGSINSQTVANGEHATKPATNPTTDNKYKTFDFWSADGTTEYKFAEEAVTADIELKAVYRDYVVGDTGPAGGTIVYIANAAYSEGSVSYGGKTLTWKYIEAAPGVVTVNGVSTFLWCTSTWLSTGFSGGVLGTKSNMAGGWYNMQFFKEKGIDNFPAAKACDDYGNGTDFDDWYLPSLSELSQALRNRSIFKTSPQQGHYWSSYTDNDKAKRVWYYALSSNGGGTDKDDSITGEKLVWPFRAF